MPRLYTRLKSEYFNSLYVVMFLFCASLYVRPWCSPFVTSLIFCFALVGVIIGWKDYAAAIEEDIERMRQETSATFQFLYSTITDAEQRATIMSAHNAVMSAWKINE
jgi:hypothetical protein